MKFKNNKAGFSLMEIMWASLISMFVIMSVYSVAVDAYKKYNSYRIQTFVIEENTKFLKALGGIRFGEGINYIDEHPVNHPNLSTLIVNFPDENKIEFRPVDLGIDNTNDIDFINTDGQKIYTYNQDLIEIKKFEITALDPDVHRGGVRMHIIFGTSGKYDKEKDRINRKATKLFGNNEYFLDYNITYTFRNSIPPEN